MRAEGFAHEDTGGGCTAYVRRYDDGSAHYITLLDDPTAPDAWDDLCGFTLFGDDGCTVLEDSALIYGPEGIPLRNLLPLFNRPFAGHDYSGAHKDCRCYRCTGKTPRR